MMTHSIRPTITTICIVGAGVSGLVAAKSFLTRGYQVTVFDSHPSLGGVWSSVCTYPGLTTQTPRDLYAFSDFPMPSYYPEWPTAQQVLDYLQAYADHFGVTPHLHLNTEVQLVKRRSDDWCGWDITVRDCAGVVSNHSFDFVVIANGTFHLPSLPQLPGMATFTAAGGHLLHTTAYTDPRLIEGKRLVVVGFGRSATDAANFAVGRARQVTLIYRRATWKLPNFFGGLLNVKYLLLNRLWEALLLHPPATRRQQMVQRLTRPLVDLTWWLLEQLLCLQFDLRGCGMVPDFPLKTQRSGLVLEPAGFYRNIKCGHIQAECADIKYFVEGGLVLSNGKHIEGDVVVFGTGFRRALHIVDEACRRHIIDEQGRYHLYRYLINPNVPDLGLVGYNSTLMTPLSSEVGSRWLVEYVEGNMHLPSPAAMEQAIAQEFAWGDAVLQPLKRKFGGITVGHYLFRHLDLLLQDMGGQTRRYPSNPLAELLLPAHPTAYRQLLATIPKRHKAVVHLERNRTEVYVKTTLTGSHTPDRTEQRPSHPPAG